MPATPARTVPRHNRSAITDDAAIEAPRPASPARPGQHSRASLARRLRLAQLLIFDRVVEAGSILAASRELAMTQPAVSKSIHELEEQMGGALFVRGRRGVVLTELGRLFASHSKTMLGELRYLAEDLNASQSGTAGHVIVGTLISASAALLPDAIMRLRRAAPDVAVTVRVGPNAMLFPALARGELDVVVGVVPRDSTSGLHEAEISRLAHVSLYKEGLCVVVGAEHPYARRRKITLAQLHGLDWIVPTPESVAYPSVRSFFDKAGLSLPKRLIESVSILTNLELLSSSPMVALMPHSAAARFARTGALAILPLEGLGSFGAVGYTVRADREPTAAAERLLEALREAGRQQQSH